MAATTTTPIVFVSGADPVKVGLVPSLSRPGGNATGVHLLIGALDPKKLGLLRELAPDATRDELAPLQLIELHSIPISQGRIAGYRTGGE
jgi:hypothetical protein